MLKLAKRVKSKPEDVVKQAIEFFGPNGYGLKVTDKEDSYATFEGGGGYVNVNASIDDIGTAVDFETREWEYQVKEFARKIK